jgi:flagellar hook-associated protein 3 FlgL
MATLSNIYENASFAMYLHNRAISRLQEQASTGNRINRPSDSPSESYRILGLNSQELSLRGYVNSLTDTISTLEISSAILEDMMSPLVETKTRLTQITGGVHSGDGQQRIAEGINDTLEQMISLANT